VAQSQILTGARALVQINGKTVGIFSNCTWSIRQGKEAVYILGRYNPGEITPTSQEPVAMDLTGYRIINAGPYVIGVAPNGGTTTQTFATKLQDLMTEEDVTITVQDRQTGTVFFTAQGCRVQGWSSGVAQRGISDIRFTVLGTIGFDESSPNGDDDTGGAIGAPKLTDGT
jgi:hypothetical protein